MLVKKLVQLSVENQQVVGFISEETDKYIIVSYANDDYSHDNCYKMKKIYKDGTDNALFQQVSQYYDPEITVSDSESFLDTYIDLNNNVLSDCLSQYSCSGEVSSYKYKIILINQAIAHSHSKKVVLKDLNTFDMEDHLDFYFNRK